MTSIDITVLHQLLSERLAENVLARLEMRVVGDSGISIKIDGQKCLTSIGVWPNGCCDVDYLFVEFEQGQFKHYEFSETREAVDPVLLEINLALERSL